jgi:hypothetical protein
MTLEENMTQLNLSGRQSTNTQQKPAVEAEDESIKNQTVGALGALAMFAAVIVIGSCSRSDKPVAAQQAVQPAAPVSTPAVTAPTPTPATAPVAAKAKAKAKKSRAATLSYVNREYGISFNFPRTYRLTQLEKATGNETQVAAAMPLPMNFAHPGGVALAAVEMPSNSYPGTDFKFAFVSVNVNPGTTSEACAQFAPPEAVTGATVSSPDAPSPVEPSPVAPSPAKIGAIEFHEVENSDAAMMKQTHAKYYHAFRNGACYEFALGVGTGGDGTGEEKPVDRGEVFGKLAKILATVKLRPAVTPETREQLPAAAATAPADSSTTAEHETAKPNF